MTVGLKKCCKINKKGYYQKKVFDAFKGEKYEKKFIIRVCYAVFGTS